MEEFLVMGPEHLRTSFFRCLKKPFLCFPKLAVSPNSAQLHGQPGLGDGGGLQLPSLSVPQQGASAP